MSVIRMQMNFNHPGGVQQVIREAVALVGTRNEETHVDNWLKETAEDVVYTAVEILCCGQGSCMLSFAGITIKLSINTLIGTFINEIVPHQPANKDKISTDFMSVREKGAYLKGEIKYYHRRYKESIPGAVKELKDIANTLALKLNDNNALSAGAVVTCVGGALLLSASGGTLAAVGALIAVNHLHSTVKHTNDALKDAVKIDDLHTKCAGDLKNVLESYKQHLVDQIKSTQQVDDLVLQVKDCSRITFDIGSCMREDVGSANSIKTERDEFNNFLVTIHTDTMKLVLTVSQSGKGIECISGLRDAVTFIERGLLIIIDVMVIIAHAIQRAVGCPRKTIENIRKFAKQLEELQIPDTSDLLIDAKFKAAKERDIHIQL